MHHLGGGGGRTSIAWYPNPIHKYEQNVKNVAFIPDPNKATLKRESKNKNNFSSIYE